jgi:hypothetical protein
MGAVVASLVVGLNWSTSSWWVTKKVQVGQKADDPGKFMRVTSSYVYMGTPVTLDFVLTCSGFITSYRDRDRSYDISGGPMLYGVRLPDGKALVLSTNAFCAKNEAYMLSPGLIPVVVIYDDATKLTQGWAYMSEAAYARPNSPLKFVDAKIALVSRDEAVAILNSQTPNVVTAFGNDGPFANVGITPPPAKELFVGQRCVGWLRVQIPEQHRTKVQVLWPTTKPKYWLSPVVDNDYHRFTNSISGSPYFPRQADDQVGIPTRQKHASAGFQKEGESFYPAPIRFSNAAGVGAGLTRELNISAETEGLFFCGGPWSSLAEREAVAPDSFDSDNGLYPSGGGKELATLLFVSGQPVYNFRSTTELNSNVYFFDQDQFMITRINYSISNQLRDQR